MRVLFLAASALSFVLRAVFGLGLVLYLILGYSPRPQVPDLPGAVERGVIGWQGRARSYVAYVPKHRARDAPLVLVLHGYLMDGAMMRRFTAYDFDTLAEQDGFVVVYPDAYDRNWNDCHKPALSPNGSAHVDDVGFLKSLIARMAGQHGIDPRRVFAFGYSNGGDMALRLAETQPAPVAAVAAVGSNLPQSADSVCALSGETPPIMLVNGTADALNPYDGGLVSLFGYEGRGVALSAPDSAQDLARRNGIAGKGTERVVAEGQNRVTRRDWLKDGRPRVSLLSVEGGGHSVPNPGFSFPPILGATARDFDSPAAAIAFFGIDRPK